MTANLINNELKITVSRPNGFAWLKRLGNTIASEICFENLERYKGREE